MKNLVKSSNNNSLDLNRKSKIPRSNFKKMINDLTSEIEAWSIFLIMFGGIMAAGKDFRIIGIVIGVVGFLGLFLYSTKNHS